MTGWWIHEPRVMGCRNPSLDELRDLRKDGFGVLVSLLREDEQSPLCAASDAEAVGFMRHNIPVKDFRAPTVAQLKTFVDLVDAQIAESKIVVHCQGGIGRTGTFAAAYWVAQGLTAADAIARVRSARPHAVETAGQEAAVQAFAAGGPD